MQAHILYYIRICSSFVCNLYVELFFFLIFRLLLLYFRILLYIAIYIFLVTVSFKRYFSDCICMYDVRHDIQIHTLYVAINRLYLYLIANLLYEDGGG